MLQIKIKAEDNSFIPEFKTDGSVGADIKADLSKPIQKEFGHYIDRKEFIEIYPNSRVTIECGFAMELPSGYEAQIRPRSGKSTKEGMHLPNSPGSIDSDYRGIIKVTAHNIHPINNLIITHGERIAQMVIKEAFGKDKVEFVSTNELSETVRGEGGYGHTGK